jgi:hypothetical protein
VVYNMHAINDAAACGVSLCRKCVLLAATATKQPNNTHMYTSLPHLRLNATGSTF